MPFPAFVGCATKGVIVTTTEETIVVGFRPEARVTIVVGTVARIKEGEAVVPFVAAVVWPPAFDETGAALPADEGCGAEDYNWWKKSGVK